MNFMLNLAYEKSTWYQSIGLEEPIAQASTSLLSFLQNRTALLGFPENMYGIPL
jgi:hypothetical protein